MDYDINVFKTKVKLHLTIRTTGYRLTFSSTAVEGVNISSRENIQFDSNVSVNSTSLR